MNRTPAFAAFSTIRRLASNVGASGFWQTMCTFRSAAYAHISSCVSGGVMMSTKSGFSSSIIRFHESYVRGMFHFPAACFCLAASRSWSATIRTSGIRDHASNWKGAKYPAPTATPLSGLCIEYAGARAI